MRHGQKILSLVGVIIESEILVMLDWSSKSCQLKYNRAKVAEPTGRPSSLNLSVNSTGIGSPDVVLGFGPVEYFVMVCVMDSQMCWGRDGSGEFLLSM